MTFTRPGGRVSIRAEEAADAVVFTVADDRIGIPATDVPYVFDRFWHARRVRDDRATSRSTGLGLAIARGIVEADGGRIWVETRSGAGSVFHFTVPVVERRIVRDFAEAAKREDDKQLIDDRASL